MLFSLCTVWATYPGFVAPTEAPGPSPNALRSIVGVGPNKCIGRAAEGVGTLKFSVAASVVDFGAVSDFSARGAWCRGITRNVARGFSPLHDHGAKTTIPLAPASRMQLAMCSACIGHGKWWMRRARGEVSWLKPERRWLGQRGGLGPQSHSGRREALLEERGGRLPQEE